MLHGNSAGAPAFGAVALATDVSGVLPVASGGTGVTSAQGNGSKVQLATGATTTNDCVKFDANGNTVDAGLGCGIQFQANGTNVGASAATFNLAPGTGMLIPMSQAGGVVLATPAVDTSVIASRSNIQAGTTLNCTETSSSGTTYTCTMAPTLTAYTANMRIYWQVGTAITGGATTMNVDTLGAKRIYINDGGSTNPSATASGVLLTLAYDGTAFRIVGN